MSPNNIWGRGSTIGQKSVTHYRNGPDPLSFNKFAYNNNNKTFIQYSLINLQYVIRIRKNLSELNKGSLLSEELFSFPCNLEF